MKRITIVLICLIFFTSACNLSQVKPSASPSASAGQEASPQPPAASLKKNCGDGVCNEPENNNNCPADCAQPVNPPSLDPPVPAQGNPTESQPAVTPGTSSTGQSAPLAATPCDQPLCLSATLSLLDLLDRPIENNVLKLFSAAVDPTRNRVYVAGIMTPDIAILDSVTQQWIGTIASGMDGNNNLKYLHIDPVANYLYIIEATHNQLRRIDLNTGEIAGPLDVHSSMGNLAVDTRRAHIYLASREAPYFSAYDGRTLELLYTADAMGEGAGKPIYDEKTDSLYVIDITSTTAQRPLYRLNPENGQILETIQYTAPERQRVQEFDRDPNSGRFFIIAGRSLLILGADGSTLNSIALPLKEYALQSMLYDPAHDRLAVLMIRLPQNGEAAGVGGHLQVYDANSGKLTSELDFGKKPHRMALDSTNARIYIPNGDASIVWSISTETYAGATELRLGDSVEQVLLTNGGSTLYTNSRLGGSYMLSYAVDTGEYATFTSGTWPIPMRTDANGEHLFVLNAWDSTLSVYSLTPERTLQATIPTGLPNGSTDRLPDLAIDTTHHLAYAAYPEYGRIAVIDWQIAQSLTTVNLDGYPAGEDLGGGPGNLQLAVDETRNYLYVLWNIRGPRLQIYDAGNAYALLQDVDFSSLDKAHQFIGPEALFLDSQLDRLFVGPFEVSPATGQPTGRSLPQGQRIFAIDPQTNTYWASGVTQNREALNYVAILDRDTLAARDVEYLDPSTTAKTTFALDPTRHLLYAAYLTAAEIKVFTVGI